MNSDPLANSYRLFEYAAFGRRLERHRLHFLPDLQSARQALILGDGDGRFLARFAVANPDAEIDCIESSRAMIEQSQKRLRQTGAPRPERIRFHCADARTVPLPAARYDLVVSHFFLDCFTSKEVRQLCGRVGAACQTNARWVTSEFQQPACGWRAWHARVWLRTMYTFFRIATHLEVYELPAYAPALESIGFALESRYSSRAGFIASELWIRSNLP